LRNLLQVTKIRLDASVSVKAKEQDKRKDCGLLYVEFVSVSLSACKDEGEMDRNRSFIFGPFRFDCARDRLWREQKSVELRAKPRAVLRYLLEHQGQIVTSSELLTGVWAGVYVSKTTLRVCLREIRLALGDEITSPRYIETIGRQGYRFIGQVDEINAPDQFRVGTLSHVEPAPSYETPSFVGREGELAQLQRWLTAAHDGHSHLVLVAGEPGLGKTTLINTFLHHAQTSGSSWIAYGQCVEQYGCETSYFPLISALGQLCRQPGAEQVARLFEQYAPLWFSRLPAPFLQGSQASLSFGLERIPHESILHELGEGLTALSTERPIVLVLEDLHWSDSATVAALAYLARRRDAARLLILGTYRPADIVVAQHPLRGLRQELLAHELCKELRVELLGEQDVKEYVKQRLAGHAALDQLSDLIYRRTDGHPLFIVNVVDYILRRGLLQAAEDQQLTQETVTAIETELPTGLQHLILREMERLNPEEQRILEVASVAGLYFAAAEVAVEDQSDEIRIEALCDGLAKRQQLIKTSGTEEWPDGTITAKYQFLHAVYHQIVSGHVGQARQVRLHRLIGERLEKAYGAQAAGSAGHLAVHFEQGRDQRAVRYRRQAAEHALRQSLYPEAYLHSVAGLARIDTPPDTRERARMELGLRQLLSATLYSTQRFLEDELEENLQRARQLCRDLEDEATLVSILVGLGRLYMIRANRAAVAELEQEEERLANRLKDAQLLVQLHTQLATIATFRGLFERADEHYQFVLQHHDPQGPLLPPASFGGDPFVVVSTWSGMSLSLAGRPDLGWNRIAPALARAEELNQPLALVNGLLCAVIMKLLRGEYNEARRLNQRMIALAHKYQLFVYDIGGALIEGCIAVQRGALEEGIAGITAELSHYRAMGAQHLIPFFLSFLAEGYRKQKKLDEALQVVSEALGLMATNFDVFWEAELYRLKGELLLQIGVPRHEEKVHPQKKKRSNNSQDARGKIISWGVCVNVFYGLTWLSRDLL
jgi:DNA-binding winged helix-turn-helix (wHTH) protein/tetratricopeptide (TPR) repeat protein